MVNCSEEKKGIVSHATLKELIIQCIYVPVYGDLTGDSFL